MDIKFTCLSFAELSKKQLYDIMVLRQEVFVVEQDCPYLDADGKDANCYHVMGYEGEELVAYTRLVPRGISYKNYTSIGRVVNAPRLRGTGIGKKLMALSIEECKKLWEDLPIKISAQCYLLKWYERFGFELVGEEYLEDDIPHHAMILKK